MSRSIIRTNKYRLLPSAKQKALLYELFGQQRFVYNQILSEIKDFKFGHYSKNEDYPNIPNQTQLGKSLTELKQTHSFLYRSANDYLQASLANLYKGFQGFYRNGGYPKFKSRKNMTQSINMYAGLRVKFNDNKIVIPKGKSSPYSKEDHLIKFKKHKTNWDLPEKVTGYTIVKEGDLYFISITFKVEISSFKVKGQSKPVGIDLGIKDIVITSNGEKIGNSKLTHKSSKKLKQAQKELSRRKKGSKNRIKSKKKVQKIHRKIKNQRDDRNHKITRKLVNIYDFIALESLQVKNMMKNRRLSKAIQDVAWGDLVTKLLYKANENQVSVVQIETFYPSSKTCSRCGCVKDELKLSERIYNCEHCGFEEDRDINAALNILRRGLELLKEN